MDVHDKLDEIVAYLESARAMPMSSSAVVNRSELLARLDAVRAMLPGSLRAAEMVLDQREELLAEAKAKGWVVVDMKADWKAIYPPAAPAESIRTSTNQAP